MESITLVSLYFRNDGCGCGDLNISCRWYQWAVAVMPSYELRKNSHKSKSTLVMSHEVTYSSAVIYVVNQNMRYTPGLCFWCTSEYCPLTPEFAHVAIPVAVMLSYKL